MSSQVDSLQPIAWHEPRSSYDVVIIGGGGHGLATAYYLATRYGITNVAVLEADGVEVDDSDAIAQPDAGFSCAPLSAGELQEVMAHVEWELPDHAAAGTVAQGKVAGVPARLLLGEPALLVVQTCYVHDLRTRLGW